MTSRGERCYPIQSHETYGFHAGVTPSDRQVLMGLFCPDLVAFFFDPEGTLLSVEQRPVGFFQGVAPPYNIFDERIPALIEGWQAEMGFQPATIKVKKFFSHQPYIGIEDYPSHYDEVLCDPQECKEEKSDIRDSMRLWDEDGQFVLQWGNDYWLDASGEVVSS
jgi:hypothetical protein